MLLSEIFSLYAKDEIFTIISKDTNTILVEGSLSEICQDKIAFAVLNKNLLKRITKLESINYENRTATKVVIG